LRGIHDGPDRGRREPGPYGVEGRSNHPPLAVQLVASQTRQVIPQEGLRLRHGKRTERLGRLRGKAGRGNRHATALAGQSVDDMGAIARSRYQFRQLRLEREKIERKKRLARKAETKLAHLESLTSGHNLDRKKAAVRAAIERARSRLARPG